MCVRIVNLTVVFIFVLVVVRSIPVEETFMKWLVSRDVRLSHVSIETTSKNGRGLYATKNLGRNEVFAEIPLSVMINIEHALHDSHVGPIVNHLNDMFGLAIFVSSSQKDNPYLQWLKRDVRASPMEWIMQNEKMMQLSIYKEAQRRRAFNMDILDRFHEQLESNLTLFELERHVFLVQSRIHSVRVRHPVTKQWHDTKCLVPVADAMNTDISSKVNTECFTNPSSTHFLCRTTRPVLAGQELLSSYANRPNDVLLLDYGFTLSTSNGDVSVRLEQFDKAVSITRTSKSIDQAIHFFGSLERLFDALTKHYVKFLSIEFPCSSKLSQQNEYFPCLSDITKRRCESPSHTNSTTNSILRIAESECVTIKYLNTEIRNMLEI